MMKYKLKTLAIHELGQRANQEDSIFPDENNITADNNLFILCDGMGGHEAGEVASATVCEAMSRSILANNNVAENFSDDILQQAISDAFDALDAKDNGAVKKMGTTMTFLMLHANGATIAHMGDSRVYHIRPGKTAEDTQILFHTEDHSLVNDLIKIGELTPEEARTSKQKNIITRAMQPRMERRPKADIYHTADIQAGDYFYMCSDGMLEQMTDEQICYHFSDENEDKVKSLTQATSQNHDNHTALIVKITATEGKAEIVYDEKKVNKPAPLMADVEAIAAPLTAEPSGEAPATSIHPRKLSRYCFFGRNSLIVGILLLFILSLCGIVASHYFQKESDTEVVPAVDSLKKGKNKKNARKVVVVKKDSVPQQTGPKENAETATAAENPVKANKKGNAPAKKDSLKNKLNHIQKPATSSKNTSNKPHALQATHTI